MSLLSTVLSYYRACVGRGLYLASSRSMRCPEEIFRTRGRGYTAELSCGLGRVWRERRTKVRDQNHGEHIQMHVGGKQTGSALVCVRVWLCHTTSSTSSRGAESLLACSLSVGSCLSCKRPAHVRNENDSVEQHKHTHIRTCTDTRQGKKKRLSQL